MSIFWISRPTSILGQVVDKIVLMPTMPILFYRSIYHHLVISLLAINFTDMFQTKLAAGRYLLLTLVLCSPQYSKIEKIVQIFNLTFFFFSVEHFTLIPYRQCKNNITQLEAILSNRYESNSSLNLCINTWTFWTKISCKELRVLNLMKEKSKNFRGPKIPFSQSLNVITTYQREVFNNWNRYGFDFL